MFDGEEMGRTVRGEALHNYIETAHATIRALPGAFDTKATAFASVITAALVYDVKDKPFPLPLTAGLWAQHSLFYAFCSLSLISLVCALAVIFARTSGDTTTLFSFVSFARRRNAQEVIREISSYDEKRLHDAALRHCYELSVICGLKNAWWRAQVIIGLLAIALFILMRVLGQDVTGWIIWHNTARL